MRKNQHGNNRWVRRKTALRYIRRFGGGLFISTPWWLLLKDKHGVPVCYVSG